MRWKWEVYANVPEIREVEGTLGVLYDEGTGGVAMDKAWTVAMVVGGRLARKKTFTGLSHCKRVTFM